MKRSENISALAKALSAFQGEVDNATKRSNNPFFGSKYADLGEVLDTIREPMSRHGLALTQLLSFNELTAMVSVETILMHESGEWLSEVSCAPALPMIVDKFTKEKAITSQSIGNAATYLRRYAASAIAGIAQEDDDGNVDKKTAGAQSAEPVWSTDENTEFDALLKRMEQAFKDLDALPEYLKVEHTWRERRKTADGAPVVGALTKYVEQAERNATVAQNKKREAVARAEQAMSAPPQPVATGVQPTLDGVVEDTPLSPEVQAAIANVDLMEQAQAQLKAQEGWKLINAQWAKQGLDRPAMSAKSNTLIDTWCKDVPRSDQALRFRTIVKAQMRYLARGCK